MLLLADASLDVVKQISASYESYRSWSNFLTFLIVVLTAVGIGFGVCLTRWHERMAWLSSSLADLKKTQCELEQAKSEVNELTKKLLTVEITTAARTRDLQLDDGYAVRIYFPDASKTDWSSSEVLKKAVASLQAEHFTSREAKKGSQ